MTEKVPSNVILYPCSNSERERIAIAMPYLAWFETATSMPYYPLFRFFYRRCLNFVVYIWYCFICRKVMVTLLEIYCIRCCCSVIDGMRCHGQVTIDDGLPPFFAVCVCCPQRRPDGSRLNPAWVKFCIRGRGKRQVRNSRVSSYPNLEKLSQIVHNSDFIL